MLRRRKGGSESPPGAPLWMVTYGDMVTQLLAMFVMFFAFSTLDAQKYKAAIASFQGALGVLPGAHSVLLGAGPGIGQERSASLQVPPAISRPGSLWPVDPQLAQIQRQLEEVLGEKGFLGEVQVEMAEDRLLLRFADQVLFDSGKADLRPDALPRLDALAEVLKRIPNRVKVEGHTDTDPIVTAQFPSNWELSTARATTVVRYFVEWHGLDPRRFEASGMGEWHPVAPNDTPENKQRNRRVDILILPETER
ncbi:MAG: OmpA family protein [Firmicutes bacterium]|nr:OmpA family protein [Bacillota bacterium]